MSKSRRVVNVADLRQFTAVELLSDPGHDPVLKPIPQCMEVRLDYAMPDGKTGHNVTHARYPNAFPGTVAMANSLKTAFVGLFTSSGLNAALNSQMQLFSVSLRDLASLNQNYIVSTSAASVIGTDIALALPLETAAVLTLRTNVSGPGGRGRIYLCGFTVSTVAAGNVIITTVMSSLNNFAAGLQAIYTAQALTMCLALPSRVAYTGSTGREHPARAAGTADITAVQVRDNHWDSQRRRGLK